MKHVINLARRVANDQNSWIPGAVPGVRKLGIGSYGIAYLLELHNLVVKCAFNDDGAIDTLIEAAGHFKDTGERMPHLPKVYHVERLPEGHRFSWFAVMERVDTSVVGGRRFPFHAELREQLYDLGLLGEDIGRADMHGGNWGVASDGTPVCFDPVAGGTSDSQGISVRVHRPPRRYGPPQRARWA